MVLPTSTQVSTQSNPAQKHRSRSDPVPARPRAPVTTPRSRRPRSWMPWTAGIGEDPGTQGNSRKSRGNPWEIQGNPMILGYLRGIFWQKFNQMAISFCWEFDQESWCHFFRDSARPIPWREGPCSW